MPFFDKKEDVLDIKLTPYGRHLMSKGKLMPKYYAFLDDDIVYDVKHTTESPVNGAETNSQIKTRIIDETPSLKPLYTFNSLEAELGETETFDVSAAEVEISNYSNEYLNNFRPVNDTNTRHLQNTLGTSKHGSFNAPRWDITLLDGEIEAAINHTSSLPNSTGISSPSASVIHIPQIDCEMTYTIEVKNVNIEEPNESSNLDIQVYEDGTYLDIQEEYFLADILEKNGFIHDESYEIQVFMYDEREAPYDENGFSDSFKPLKFMNKLIAKNYRVEKDIFIEDPSQTQMEADRHTVEYYFDLRVDEEIPETDICKAISEIQSQGIYIKDFNIKCPDLPFDSAPNIGLPLGEPCVNTEEVCDDE